MIPKPTFKEFTAEKIQFIAEHSITPDMIASYKVETEWSEILRCIIIRLRGEVLARCVIETEFETKTEVPISWWQHLRKRLGFKWKSETIDTKVTIKRYHVCPHIAVPDTQQHYRFLINEKPNLIIGPRKYPDEQT